MYEARFYRYFSLRKFRVEVTYQESDLYIITDKELNRKKARQALIKYYTQINDYVQDNPAFLTALSPLKTDNDAPRIVKDMISASRLAGIGPFSAVAGAIASYVGGELIADYEEIIIENGGDIFLKIQEDKTIGLYLGRSFSPSVLALKIRKRTHQIGRAHV